jgi:hypothetical protein
MKKQMVWLIAGLLASGMAAYASPAQANAGVSINLPGFGLSVSPAGVGLNIGLPWVVAPPPEPVYAYPETAYETVVTEQPPEFVQPPEVGFYVAVGVPYDLFFYNNSYYVNRGNLWYNSPYYNGPWTSIYYSNVPYVFNRLPFERIRHYRDSYYGRYQRYGAWEGYNHFRPGHRADYRGGAGHDRRDYARPQNQGQTYRNGPDVRRPNSSLQNTGRGYTATRQINRDQGSRNSRVYTRSSNNGQVNSARPAYNRTNGANQRYVGRPAQIRPVNYAPVSGNKTAYKLPNKSGHYYGNGSANIRQNVTGQRNERKGFDQSQSRPGNVARGWQGSPR